MEPSYILGNANPEKTSYISENGNPEFFFIFQEMELSYISGGTYRAPKTKICYISRKIFFLLYCYIIYIIIYFPNCHVFVKKFYIFYQKIHAFSPIRISFISAHFCKEYA